MPVKDLEYRVVIDDTGAIKTVNKVDKAQDKLNKNAKKRSGQQTGFLKKISAGWIAVAAILTGVVVRGFTAVIKKGIDAEETISKFNTVFASVRKEADKMAKNLSDNFLLSSIKARQLLSDTGDLLSGFGFTAEASLKLSNQVAELGSDLASFSNFSGGAEGATQALTKALLGERESAKSLGIVIQEAGVQQRLLEKGQKGLTGSALMQAKAQATLEIAMEQSKLAIGDVGRTAGSSANLLRTIGSAADDLQVIFATKLLPQLKPILKDLAEFAKSDEAMTGAAKAGKVLLVIFEILKLAVNNLLIPLKGLAIIGQSAFIVIEGTIQKVIKRFAFLSKGIDFVKNGFKKLATGVKDFFDVAEAKINDEIAQFEGPMGKALKNLKDGFKGIGVDTAKQYEEVFAQFKDLLAEQEKDFFNNQDSIAGKSAETQDAITDKIKLSKEERKELDNLTKEEQFMDEEEKLENKIANLQEFIDFRVLTEEEEKAAKVSLAELEKQLSEEVKEKRIADAQEVLSVISTIEGKVSGVIDAFHNHRLKTIEDEKNRGIISAEDAAKKKAEAEHKMAFFRKAQAISQTLVDTAKAVVAALPNIPLSIAMGALGAIQTGVIAATPIPALPGFRGGGRNIRGKRRAMVGEGGPEAMDIPDGASIFNNSESKMMASRGIPLQSVTTNSETNNNQRSFNIARAIFMKDTDYDEQTNSRLRLGGDFV